MKEIKEKGYEAPKVELMNAHVEKGFAGSVAPGNPEGLDEGDEHGDELFS